MDPEIAKKAYEGISHVLSNEAAFNELVDKIWKAVESGKGGSLDIDTLEKGINESIEKMGGKKIIEREKVEKMFAALTSDKAKTATRDDVSKHIRGELEKKKAEIEALGKK